MKISNSVHFLFFYFLLPFTVRFLSLSLSYRSLSVASRNAAPRMDSRCRSVLEGSQPE